MIRSNPCTTGLKLFPVCRSPHLVKRAWKDQRDADPKPRQPCVNNWYPLATNWFHFESVSVLTVHPQRYCLRFVINSRAENFFVCCSPVLPGFSSVLNLVSRTCLHGKDRPSGRTHLRVPRDCGNAKTNRTHLKLVGETEKGGLEPSCSSSSSMAATAFIFSIFLHQLWSRLTQSQRLWKSHFVEAAYI